MCLLHTDANSKWLKVKTTLYIKIYIRENSIRSFVIYKPTNAFDHIIFHASLPCYIQVTLLLHKYIDKMHTDFVIYPIIKWHLYKLRVTFWLLSMIWTEWYDSVCHLQSGNQCFWFGNHIFPHCVIFSLSVFLT